MIKIQKLLNTPMHRYVIIGGSVYLFELAVILIAQALGTSPVQAVALSFILGTLVSFVLQKVVTFSDKRMHHSIVVPQFIATCLLVVVNFGFTILVTKLLAHMWPAICSRTLALGVTTIWNFYLYKTRIFNQAALIT